jgi:hypothetical protein
MNATNHALIQQVVCTQSTTQRRILHNHYFGVKRCRCLGLVLAQ